MPLSLPRPVVVVVGDVATDIVVRMHAPLATASDTPAAIAVRPGGSAANAAAWLASRGVDAHFVGRVGSDPFGAYHLDELRAVGVAAHVSVDPARSTGTVVVLVDPAGERSMLPDRGAALGLEADNLPRDLFRPGRCLHLSGYMLLDPATRGAGLAALRLARERGMAVSIDPSSASLLSPVGPSDFLAWTRSADYCFPNLDEGRLLSGEDAPDAVARALCAWYHEVALTCGADGAIWASREGDIVAQSAVPIDVLDTTGAGDAFCAGFLAARLSGADGSAALRAGIRLSAVAVGRVGARPPTTRRSRPGPA